jgi:hypothetical protein
MRKTLTTAALLLALSCPALAGEMATPGSPAPPPSDPADGIIQGGQPAAAAEDGDNTDALTEFALTLLVSVLS